MFMIEIGGVFNSAYFFVCESASRAYPYNRSGIKFHIPPTNYCQGR